MLDSKTPVLLPKRATATDLDRFHDFDCGDEDYQRELVDFLHVHALGEARSRYNTSYVFYDDHARPLAFVALACSSIDRWDKASANAWNVPVLLIEMLAVDRRSQHRGVGAEIMRWVREVADNLPVGCRFLALYCDERNDKARAFYRRQGFFEPPLPPEGYGERLMLYDLAS
jgi:GNAT superfamily N-acetyltransferase